MSCQLCSLKKLFWKFSGIPRKSFTRKCILKAQNWAKCELCHWRSSRNFPKIFRTAILKVKLLLNPYLQTFHISLKNTSGWVLLMRQQSKNIFGGSKTSSKLTLKTKCYHSCGCCDDCQSCEQLKKHVLDKYFEKNIRLWILITFHYRKSVLLLQCLSDWYLHWVYVWQKLWRKKILNWVIIWIKFKVLCLL